jgi:hypothetical protein
MLAPNAPLREYAEWHRLARRREAMQRWGWLFAALVVAFSAGMLLGLRL